MSCLFQFIWEGKRLTILPLFFSLSLLNTYWGLTGGRHQRPWPSLSSFLHLSSSIYISSISQYLFIYLLIFLLFYLIIYFSPSFHIRKNECSSYFHVDLINDNNNKAKQFSKKLNKKLLFEEKICIIWRKYEESRPVLQILRFGLNYSTQVAWFLY